MAKDNRVINGAVRVGATVFRAGQEDELQEAASPAVLKRLAEKGVISGDFAKAGKPKAAPVETKEADNKEAGTKDK